MSTVTEWEIFLLATDEPNLNQRGMWIRLDFNGTNWEQTFATTALANGKKYIPGSDFNGDGIVELYSGTQIWRQILTVVQQIL